LYLARLFLWLLAAGNGFATPLLADGRRGHGLKTRVRGQTEVNAVPTGADVAKACKPIRNELVALHA
jgi:hypothetical protein